MANRRAWIGGGGGKVNRRLDGVVELGGGLWGKEGRRVEGTGGRFDGMMRC